MHLAGFDERTRRRYSQDIDFPTEKLYKLFSELPPVREDDPIVQTLEQPRDAITKSLAQAEEVTRMMNEMQKRRQANQHRRGGHRR